MEQLHNNELYWDLEKINGYDAPISVAKSHDDFLDVPWAIDVEDTSYFYRRQNERDEDYEKLKQMFSPKFSFIH